MLHRWVGIALLAMLFAGCEKTGPQGPEGPEGPPGNNGTGGGGGSAVVSYGTEGSGIGAFRWEEAGSANPGYTGYRLVAERGGNRYDRLTFTDTTGTADDGVMLVYVRLFDNDGEDTWVGLPYEVLGGTLGTRYHVDALEIVPVQSGGRTVHDVSVGIGATQFNDPRWPPEPPHYRVREVRVLVIPAGSVGNIGAMLRSLPMEEVVARLGGVRN